MVKKTVCDLTGHRILLTGPTGYFGRSIAHALVDAGAEIILAGRSPGKLARLTAEIRQSGGVVYPVQLDVADDSSRREAIDRIAQCTSRLDGVVNNAYSGRVGVLETITPEDFLSASEQNMVGPFHLIQLALPLLSASAATWNDGSTSIVNVASMYGIVSPDPAIYGDTGANNPIHYGATKAGMIQMTRYLACHLASRGIRVNSISPGPFPPPGIERDNPAFHANLIRKVPMGRIGQAKEVAGPVAFLLSAAASYITGVNLPIDGGWTAW